MHNQCITTIDILTRLHQNETGGNITVLHFKLCKNTFSFSSVGKFCTIITSTCVLISTTYMYNTSCKYSPYANYIYIINIIFFWTAVTNFLRMSHVIIYHCQFSPARSMVPIMFKKSIKQLIILNKLHIRHTYRFPPRSIAQPDGELITHYNVHRKQTPQDYKKKINRTPNHPPMKYERRIGSVKKKNYQSRLPANKAWQ